MNNKGALRGLKIIAVGVRIRTLFHGLLLVIRSLVNKRRQILKISLPFDKITYIRRLSLSLVLIKKTKGLLFELVDSCPHYSVFNNHISQMFKGQIEPRNLAP